MNRRGYRDVARSRPEVAWVDPPELPASPKIDWEWIAEVLDERPGQWLRVTHPVPGRRWSAPAAWDIPHLAPFRPRDSHEGAVVDGYLYLRRRPHHPDGGV